MDETTGQPTTSTTPVAQPSRRQRVSNKIMGAEGRFFMGRVMPRELLDSIEDYLHGAAPGRENELMDAIETRADELIDADQDLVVDGPSKGMLALTATILACYETLLPLFDGDERRTIVYLQEVFGKVLKKPYEFIFKTLSERDHGLDKIDKACRGAGGLYGSSYDMRFARPEPGLFEMNVHKCFFLDFFTRHDVAPVTTVLCAWDANWMRAIDPAESGLRAERTSLLSLGDTHCRFAVMETDDPTARYSDRLSDEYPPASVPDD